MTNEELFYQPEKYNLISFPNIWNAQPDPRFTGMFMPARQPDIDEFGNMRDVDENMLNTIEQAKKEGKHLMILGARHRIH